MRLIDKKIDCKSRSNVYEIYPLGDIHCGARNCAERPLKKLVNEVVKNPFAYVIGGGDLVDAIKPDDFKRFDMDILPDWMIEGDAMTTREKLNDILEQQLNRITEILEPIKHKILGTIEGNHEYNVRKYYNQNIQKAICNRLGIEGLTDEALIRIRFKRLGGGTTVIIYIRHGYGGGRTPGAEPNKLDRMLNEWEIADICFTGHTHTFDILPPKPVLGIPKNGALPKECTCRYRWAGNWGCWLYSHAEGASSYSSRACYQARPMLTVKAVIRPFAQKKIKGQQLTVPHIELRSITI